MLVSLLLSLNVSAENITAVRSIYQKGEEFVMESESLREDYVDSSSIYSDVRTSLRDKQIRQQFKNTALKQAEDMMEEVGVEVSQLTSTLNSIYNELTDAVNRELNLSDIYEIENRYQQIKNELSYKLSIYNDLTTFLLVYDEAVVVDTETIEQELMDNYILMRQLQADYEVALTYEDVGDVKDVKSPISTGKLKKTSGYGLRPNPFDPSVYQFHHGLDLSAPLGTQILSLFSGTVIVSDYSNTYGNYLIIDHGHGVRTLYGHATKNLVEVGDFVTQYDIIQDSGSTGWSTGPHLHLALSIDGEYVDPYILFTEGA